MHRSIQLLVAPLLLALCTQPAIGQGSDAPKESASTSTSSGFGGDRATPDEINFPGGTFGEYAELLRKTFPDTSIVLAPGVSTFMVPKITAKVGSAGSALKLACGLEGEITYPDGGTYGGELNEQLISRDLYRVIAVKNTTRTNRTLRAEEPASQEINIYPLVELLDQGISIEEVLGTLKVAFDLDAKKMPTLKYHEETRILFLKGTNDQYNVFRKTMSALDTVATDRALKKLAQHDQNEHAQLQLKFAETHAAYQKLQKEHLALVERMNALMERMNAEDTNNGPGAEDRDSEHE